MNDTEQQLEHTAVVNGTRDAAGVEASSGKSDAFTPYI
jgi:hypothetical protein